MRIKSSLSNLTSALISLSLLSILSSCNKLNSTYNNNKNKPAVAKPSSSPSALEQEDDSDLNKDKKSSETKSNTEVEADAAAKAKSEADAAAKAKSEADAAAKAKSEADAAAKAKSEADAAAKAKSEADAAAKAKSEAIEKELLDTTTQSVKEFPFNLSIDMNIVKQVVTTDPEKLIDLLQGHFNIDIFLVKSDSKNTKPKNMNFSNLKLASEDLIKKSEFNDYYDRHYISKTNSCCKLKKDTILIRDSASDIDLIHEFLYTVIKSRNLPLSANEINDQFNTLFRTLKFRQRKIYDNPYILTNPQWRQDIQNAQRDVLKLAFASLQINQVQDVIFEKILQATIKSSSKYFSPEQVKESSKYGEFMMNNTIDVYNTIFHSLKFTNETVFNVNEGIKNKEIELDPKTQDRLDDKDVELFTQENTKLQIQLDQIKSEILKLKTFYSGR